MPAYQWEFQAKGADTAAKMATALTRMDKVATTLTPALNNLTASVNALTDGLRPLADAFNKVADSSTSFRKAIQPLIRYTEKHAEGFRLLASASTTVAKSSQDVTASMKQQASAASSHTTIVNNTTNVINNLGRAMDGARGANKRFHTDFWQSLRNFNTFNAAIQYTRLRISEIGQAMTGVFQKTQQFGGGFESAERQLGVFMGAGQSPAAKKDFEAVVKAAEKTAMETTVGGSDALRAAISASKAGMQRGDIAKALPTIINASIAEGMDASRIAEIGSITSSQFKRTGLGKGEGGGTIAADASGSIKILQATAAASSTDINQLFESLKNSASGATMLGMSLDETAATLAVLSQNGETGGRAGTRLMMAFSRMATQTPQATEAMKKLGVTFKDDATGNVKPFTEILDDLKTKLAGVQGNAQKMDYLKKIFGESFSSMAFLVEQGGDAIKKSMQDIKNSMNVGDELQKENMSGMAGAMEAFKGSYEQVFVSLRKTLSVPISQYWLTLADTLNAVSARLSDLGTAFDQAKTVEDWLNVLSTTDFSDVFSGLAEEFAKEIEVLKKLAGGIWSLMKSGFQAIWKEIDTEKVMTTVTSSLGKASGALFKSIFTTENMAAATAFGVELGKQILAGLTQSSSGITALFAGVGILGGDVMRNVAGGLSGMLNAGGQPSGSPIAQAPATRRTGMRQQGNEPARVTFGAQPGDMSRFREMTAADAGQRWRVADRPGVNIGKEMVGSFRSALSKGLSGLQVVAANANMAIATGVFLGNLVNQGVNTYFGGKDAKQDDRGAQATRDLLLKLYTTLGKTNDREKRADLLQRISRTEEDYRAQTGKYSEFKTNRDAFLQRQAQEDARRAAATPEGKMRTAGMDEASINKALGMIEEFQKVTGRNAILDGTKKEKATWLESSTMFDKEIRVAMLEALGQSKEKAEAQATREEKIFKTAEYGRWAKGQVEAGRAAEDRKLDRYAGLNTAWNSSATGKVDFMRNAAMQELIGMGVNPNSPMAKNAMQGMERNAVMQMGEAQYMRYQDAYTKAKASEGRNRLANAEPQTQEEVDAALKRLGIEKEILSLKRQEAETAAQIANAPIEAQMKNNETENAFQKFLIEPVNAFAQKIGDVMSKFTETLAGMGQKKTDIKLKGGLINEEEAKKENIVTTEDSIKRGEKLLRIAQGAGQKADAYEAQAGRLAELGQLTGDQSKTAQADAMMKKAIDARKEDEENQIKGIELDQDLAKKNIKSLESKRDGSASEAVSRLQQLFESYQQIGDVSGAAKTKEALQKAQREAAGEQVGVLKQILQELKLSRKGSDLQMQEQNGILKQTADKTAQAVSQSANAMPLFDPGMAAPAY